jgi:hypothetical protein
MGTDERVVDGREKRRGEERVARGGNTCVALDMVSRASIR